ncbi:hypothetical protein [Methylibium sp. T29]|nr:hypothetical protein [Methylibium sp. T29]
MLHAIEVLAGFLEEDLVELAQVDAGAWLALAVFVSPMSIPRVSS